MSDSFTNSEHAHSRGQAGSRSSQRRVPLTSEDPTTRELIQSFLGQPSADSKSPSSAELQAGQESFLGLPSWVMPFKPELKTWADKTTALVRTGQVTPLNMASIWAIPVLRICDPVRPSDLVFLDCPEDLEVVDGMRLVCVQPQINQVVGTITVYGPATRLREHQAKALIPGAWVDGAAWRGRLPMPPLGDL